MRPIVFGILLDVVASGAHDAYGACPDSGRDWIAVEFDASRPIAGVDSERQQLEQRVLDHLRAEFRPQNIDVCASMSTQAPAALATLRIERDASNEAFVRAWANDAVTQKELGRRLSLAGLPKDAHALAIALGASELLRASWIELRLESSSRADKLIPPSVEQAVRSHEKPQHSNGDFGASIAAEAFSGGVKQAGVDGKVTLALGRDVEAVIRFGGRASISAASTHGRISTDGWLLGVGANVVIARPAPSSRLLLQARSDVMRVNFSGSAGREGVATSASDVTCWGALGLGVDLRISDGASVDGGVLAGRVMTPIVATDEGKRVLGFTQGLVAAHAGIKVPF